MTCNNLDSQVTLGRELVYLFDEIVDSEDLSIHECQQVLFNRLGTDFNIGVIRDLNQSEITLLTKEYNDYFEVTGVVDNMLTVAFQQAIDHWTNK